MEERRLLQRVERCVIPFWNSEGISGFTFRKFIDKNSVPAKYRKNIIYITVELYYNQREEGYKDLSKEITLDFSENWTSKNISPQNLSYSKRRPIVVPKFKYVFSYQSQKAIDNPDDVFNGNRFREDVRLVTLTGEYLSDLSDLYGENSYANEQYKVEIFIFEPIDYLEFSVCALLLLSGYSSSLLIPDHIEAALEIMSGRAVLGLSYGLGDIAEVVTMFNHVKDNYPLFPEKFLYAVNSGLLSYLRESCDINSKIEVFLAEQGFTWDSIVYDEEYDESENDEDPNLLLLE